MKKLDWQNMLKKKRVRWGVSHDDRKTRHKLYREMTACPNPLNATWGAKPARIRRGNCLSLSLYWINMHRQMLPNEPMGNACAGPSVAFHSVMLGWKKKAVEMGRSALTIRKTRQTGDPPPRRLPAPEAKTSNAMVQTENHAA
jgi:hypothetical protein